MIFEQLLKEQEKSLRTLKAKCLWEIRKLKAQKLISASKKGYLEGFNKGAKDGQRSFTNTSKLVRSFKKHLEQVAVSSGLEILQELALNNKSVINQIIQNMIVRLTPKLRSMSLLKIYLNPNSNITAKTIKESLLSKLPVEYDSELETNQIKFVSVNGELIICGNQALKQSLESAIEKLCHL